jgi:hypothetical protein
MGDTMKWVSVDEDLPDVGEKIVALNPIREWVTEWKPGLLLGTYPVTHYAILERPYQATHQGGRPKK